MHYELTRLSSYTFEKMIQSLCQKILGNGVKIFGSGPDGQREATFEGKAAYPGKDEMWEGYWVIQVKFKSATTKEKDYEWIRKNFVDEMKGFMAKKAADKKIPDNYLFFTNIVLTPKEQTGIHDKLNKLAQNYKELIPNISFIGYDEICALLDNNRDVATAYSSFILSGDIISLLYKNITDREVRNHKALLRYISTEFKNDMYSRMEQAGQYTDAKVLVDKVYIDLNFEFDNFRAPFVRHTIDVSNNCMRDFGFSNNETRRVQSKNQISTTNKFVLKGSAGQGKSTVCQFLSQIYRAAFFKQYADSEDGNIKAFLERLETEEFQLPVCCRVPVRIVLRLYSGWIEEREKAHQSVDLIDYIIHIINDASSFEFEKDILRLYFKKFSWLFIFDGLDEVPETSNRKTVMQGIEKFMQIELAQANCDSVFIATTRPEGYVGEFKDTKFAHLNLSLLDEKDCMKYLNKLLDTIANNDSDKKEYLKILEKSLKSEQTSYMMKTPLQATIMAILVRSGGEPPRNKYTLFKDYFDIIIKREKQKSVGTVLNECQDIIVKIYKLLGFELQRKSSTTERSNALLSKSEMGQLIEKYLADKGYCQSDDGYSKLLKDIFDMIVLRINFAAEIQEDGIGFSIRSMQEYLAAEHIIVANTDESLRTILYDIAQNSYWKNTFSFLVAGLEEQRPHMSNYLVDTVLAELNGNNLPLDEVSCSSSIKWGSQIAYYLLLDNTFIHNLKVENKLCKYLDAFCDLNYRPDLISLNNFTENARREFHKILLNRAKSGKVNNGFYELVAVAAKTGYDDLKDIILGNPVEVILAYHRLYGNYEEPYIIELLNSVFEQNPDAFEIDSNDIIYLICKLNKTEGIKKALFKYAVMLSIDYRYRGQISASADNIYINYFGFEFNCFYHLLNNTDEFNIKNFEGRINIGRWDAKKMSKVISVAEKYDFKALSEILNCICSSDADKYIDLIYKLDEYKVDIQKYRLIILINFNAILNAAYRKTLPVKYERTELKKYINTILQLNTSVKTIKQCIELMKEEIDLVSLYFIHDKSYYFNLFEYVMKYIGEEEFANYHNINMQGIFFYACILEYLFEETSQSYIKKIKYWQPYVFRMIKESGSDCFWTFSAFIYMLMKTPRKEYISFADIDLTDVRKNYITAGDIDKNEIVKCLNDYILITENYTALNMLFKLISNKAERIKVKDINWKELLKSGDVRVDIANILVNEEELTDEMFAGNEKFILEFIQTVFENNDYICGLLIRLLIYFRKKSDYDEITKCESLLNNILTTNNITI